MTLPNSTYMVVVDLSCLVVTQICDLNSSDPVERVGFVSLDVNQFKIIPDNHGWSAEYAIREVNIAGKAAIFLKTTQHHDLHHTEVPNHPPEIDIAADDWPLSCNKLLLPASVRILNVSPIS